MSDIISLSNRARLACEHSIEKWFESMPLPSLQSSQLTPVDLSAGDPTVRNFDFNNVVNEKIKELLKKPETYFNSASASLRTREYIAKLHSAENYKFKEEDIFITQGGEFALTYIMNLLCSPEDNFIVPSPGYWHLGLAAKVYDRECRTYGFDASWRINFEELELKIDSKTKFILVVSPGNPNCVSYDLEVMKKFTEIAAKHKLVIVSDEIYYRMRYDLGPQLSPAHVDSDVPVVIMAGLAKTCSVPGFAVEWLAIKDPSSKLKGVKDALFGLTESLGTSSHFIQNILPEICELQLSLLSKKMQHIQKNYQILLQYLSGLNQVTVMPCDSSMFASLVLNTNKLKQEVWEDQAFCSLLIKEQALKLGRGLFNGQIGLIRICLVMKEEEYHEGLPRLITFLNNHSV